MNLYFLFDHREKQIALKHGGEYAVTVTDSSIFFLVEPILRALAFSTKKNKYVVRLEFNHRTQVAFQTFKSLLQVICPCRVGYDGKALFNLPLVWPKIQPGKVH